MSCPFPRLCKSMCLCVLNGKKALRKNEGKLVLSQRAEKLSRSAPPVLFTTVAEGAEVSLPKIFLANLKLIINK